MEPTRITLVPHTHWDREWYGPFDEFLPRLVEMMDTLIEHADRGFPHFHLDGQTAMIDDYLAVRPDRTRDVERLARTGKVSVGPWVTQMDEFLTSGESHIRDLEMGLARARELGPPLEVGYLPDQFGHIGQMPQILRQAGIERAVVWRGVPAVIDRTGFWWEAPDGSRVLTEYLAFGYFLGGDLARFQDPETLTDALRRKVEQVSPFLATDRMLITVGSDHTGPDPRFPLDSRPWEGYGRARRSPSALSPTISGVTYRKASPCGGASCDRPPGRTCFPTSTRHACTRSASVAGSRQSSNDTLNPSLRSCPASSGRRRNLRALGPSCSGTAHTIPRAAAPTTSSHRTSIEGSRRLGRGRS